MRQAIVLFLLIFGNLGAQDISFKSRLDSTQYLIGDPITINIDASYPSDYRLIFPTRSDSLSPLEFLYTDTLSLNESRGRKEGKFGFVVTGFDSGLFRIPQLPFLFAKGNGSKSFNSDSFYVLIATVAVDTSQAIKDIKALEKIPFDYSFLFWLIPLLVLLFGLGYYLYNKYKNRHQTETIKTTLLLAPYDEAYQSLQDLEKKQLWQNGLYQEFHVAITGIIRNYFEREFTMPALESTSAETIEFLRSKKIDKAVILKTESFLESADLVKFAKFVPLTDLNQKMMTNAYDILRESHTMNIGTGQ